jgi:hypothetical protein
MPLRLLDIKKTVRSRGDGERYVHPKLLHAANMEGQVSLALAYFHARLGRKRRDFEPELLVRFFGEPKVARALVACLSSTYRWRTQRFSDVLEPRDLLRLALQGIEDPSQLRLHLFDVVNQESNGFLAGEHDAALLKLALRLELSAPALEQLFTLDAEENAVLVRIGDAPEPTLVVALYDFQVVHALIRNCAFLEFPGITGSAVRALADACNAYDVVLTGQDGTPRVHNRADTFGNFAHWGQRVARALYTAASVAPSLLESGRARVHVGGKPAWYVFDHRTLFSLTGGRGAVRCVMLLPELVYSWQHHRPAGGAGGWQLTSMAEPLVSGAGLTLTPYAMRRDERQILLWPIATPADCAAVQDLHGQDLPVLAIRLPSCAVSLPPEIAYVDLEAGAAGILAALNDRWGGGRVDAGAQALEEMLVQLDSRGFIPETQVGEALGCGSLDDLPSRLQALDPASGTFVPGLGLCSPTFAQAMRRGLRRQLRPKPAA